MNWRRLLKRVLVRAYCHRLLPFSFVCWVFRHVDLKEV